MAPAVRIFKQFRASDGRVKVATLSGVAGLVIALALVVGVFPAIAESDGPDVDPVVVQYGGGSGACAFVDSAAGFELHINNPKSGTFTGPDGTEVAITVDGNFFDFQVLTPGMGVYDVVVNGGTHNNHFDYDDRGDGPATEDDGLHPPRKGGPNSPTHNLSHTNICYDELPLGTVSGTKYHDRDTDGNEDVSEELGLQGWTMTAFDSEGNGTDATTGEDGSYTIADLAAGTYTICEQTDTSGLPSNPAPGVTWAWTQSEPSDSTSGDCSEFDGYEPFGHTVEINGNDVEDIDFGNHRQVSVTCDPDNDVVVTLDGGNDEPSAAVTFPAGCQSGVGGNDPYTTSFDLGLSDDADDWKQFVVFGGDPNSQEVLEQTIEWAPETANYTDGSLVVPTTQVLLDLGGTVPDDLENVTFCHTLTDEIPNTDVPQCIESRVIAEGSPLDPGDIQLTETYKLLGDPGNFR